MIAIDTNILVYARRQESAHHEAARELLKRLAEGDEPWALPWPCIYEFLRVVTHPRVLEHPWGHRSAWSFLEALLASPNLSLLAPTDRHTDVARAVVDEMRTLRGNLFHDAQTAILMREHGIRRIVTNDADFHRFGFLEVIDPFSQELPA